MKIAVHANHRAIEYYLYSLLPDVEFLRVGTHPQPDMVLRQMPLNCFPCSEEKALKAKPDAAIARDIGHVELFRWHEIPTIFFLSGPPQPDGQKKRRLPWLRKCQAIVVYSEEHKALWSAPGLPPIHVCRYPIDTEVFKGYTGEVPKALMIATMPMNWWAMVPGDWKGGWLLRECLDEGIPFQLVGFNNDQDWDDANPYPINSEAEMVACLARYRVYAHTGSFLCRSPLEAMAVGLPVVIRQTLYSHYAEEFPPPMKHSGLYRAATVADFKAAVRRLLFFPDEAREVGQAARATVRRFFSPELVRQQWLGVLGDVA